MLKKLTLFQNMSIFWCKNVFPAPGMKCCCLQKKNMCNHSGFYQGLSGHYMASRNYIAASAWKRGLQRPKVLYKVWKFIPSPTLSYTITKARKTLRVLNLLRVPMIRFSLVPSETEFSLEFLVIRSFLGSSGIVFSLGSLVIESSLGPSVISPQWQGRL